MELKKYQRAVLDDLSRFLNLLSETGNITEAYKLLWTEKGVNVGFDGMKAYNNRIPGVPNVCVKVPTGGGKTFIACNAIKPVFESLPFTKTKAVVWLVPSESILEQTLRALSDAQHDYRQKINSDFSHRVEVYSKQQLLSGQSFNPTVINEQLSLFVLSYDSFRTSNKEGRKAYQENGNLALFAKIFNDPSILLADTDETALIQVIRHLNPVLIVDESHHATTTLSVDMLKNFNPSFILDLTATPHHESNVISYVDALQLKKENMVKLPVIVYNRHSQYDVFTDAVSIQNKLEYKAIKERGTTGRYIRPIVLFQAQPKTGEESTTFDKIKKTLVDIGIPVEQIAIKTGDKNDLKGIDLLSEDCPIRYIITVNALKEGWDCPFAYILATVANRTSVVDVEQILGRILRLPYTKKNSSNVLNISYVITSSTDFHATLQKVVDGLHNAGFSDKDYRTGDADEPASDIQTPVIETVQTMITEITEGLDIPADKITEMRERIAEREAVYTATPDIESDPLLSVALEQSENYDAIVALADDSDVNLAPTEVRDKMNVFHLCDEFREEAKALRLPQFVIQGAPSLFSDSEKDLLTPESLAKGFSLRDKDTVIDFTTLEAEIASVDIEGSQDALPKAWKLKGTDNKFFREWFDAKPQEWRVEQCKGIILKQLSKINMINDRDLKEYIGRVVNGLTQDQLEDLQKSPYPYSAKINKKINALLAVHQKKNFELWVEQGIITCEPSYAFKESISPTSFTTLYPNSLYKGEEDMNGLEKDVVMELSSLPNIKWWHRNIARSGFNINGYINAFPDIIAMTRSGRILMIEPKGDHLDGSGSENKAIVGRTWERKAGERYRYYMVFRNKELSFDGAVRFDRLLEIVRGL